MQVLLHLKVKLPSYQTSERGQIRGKIPVGVSAIGVLWRCNFQKQWGLCQISASKLPRFFVGISALVLVVFLVVQFTHICIQAGGGVEPGFSVFGSGAPIHI